MNILYLSSVLPKRSETFVYREVLGLQALGVDVGVASLYPPEKNLGEPALDAMASGVVTVYEGGHARLLKDAFSYFFRHPLRASAAMALAKMDAFAAGDIRLRDRPKVVFQGLAGLALARRIGGRGYGRLHVHMAHAAATVGMYAARALGIPFSFTGHAADLFRERCLLKQKLRRAAFVACISEWHREWYRTIFDRPDADYPVIRCGVDVPDAPFPSSATPPLRLLGLGRLVPKKGFDVLVRACRILADDGIALECVIAGDGPEAENLKALAAGLPVTFPGAVANRDVPSLLAGTDVFVLPCQISHDGDRDGIPVVLMEAMAHGICAVSGDLPTIRELIADAATGCLVPPGDAHALADRLRRLALDPVHRGNLAAAGRARVQEEFSSEKNLGRILSAFTRR
jgi:glycosyltransferase involved in cell wall biosynthesis